MQRAATPRTSAPDGAAVQAAVRTTERAGAPLPGDVRGVAVHLASRIMDQAGPGEVLVSGTVKDLVAGSGIGFSDRGEHVLKGIPDEWRIYAVAR